MTAESWEAGDYRTNPHRPATGPAEGALMHISVQRVHGNPLVPK
jgi:hypothetical protein